MQMSNTSFFKDGTLVNVSKSGNATYLDIIAKSRSTPTRVLFQNWKSHEISIVPNISTGVPMKKVNDTKPGAIRKFIKENSIRDPKNLIEMK